MNDDQALASRVPPSHLPFRAGGLLQIPTGASSSAEDYRGVIDDLTVQNRKLKRKLRKYEKLHDAHLQDDKLFEIRVHALPANKKRELEDMLQKFSMTLGDAALVSTAEPSTGANPSKRSTDRYAPPLEAKKTSSSHASTRFGDSAYASMSLSGQNSIAPSGQASLQRKQPRSAMSPENAMSHQQNQNIHSYLKDIPAGLLPKHTVAMSEKAKRKMVVRRLEQIFAGKGPAPGGHQQPIQQQEVAQSAARADRQAIEDSGERAREEGAREALIMPKSKGDPTDHVTEPPIEMEVIQDLRPTIMVSEQDSSDAVQTEAPEQRPTRPLDLDPYRAQVPAENIEYIRHLGFSPMDADSSAPAPDGHGWIYLNLLTNMAQLHTINVTADFVRRSIADFSKKLELSPDGRKVRWKGGSDVTGTSSDGSPEDENHVSHSLRMKETNPKKGCTLAIVSNDGSSENVSSSRRMASSNANSRDKFAYTPLFFHKADSEDEDEFSEGITSWSSPPAGFVNAGNSSGFNSSDVRTNGSKKKRGDDGPIIFYNKAGFCTDLSGDPRPRNVVFANSASYERLETDPVGAPDDEISVGRLPEQRGPLSKAISEAAGDAMDVDNPTPSDEMELNFATTKGKLSDASSNEELPNFIDFEASGIGGVLPHDNFAIRVKSRRKLVEDQSSSIASKKEHRAKAIPPHLRDILAERVAVNTGAASLSAKNGSVVEEEILSTRRKILPPSKLPPASFFPFSSPDDSDSSSNSDAESSESSDDNAGLSRDRPLPTSAPQVMEWQTYDSGSESEREDNGVENEDDDEDDVGDMDVEHPGNTSSDESVDLLAHARVADPSAIRLREREYDASISDRWGEEIPAGSSAATAGGRSGSSSPVEAGVGAEKERDDGTRFVSGASARRGVLKRNRTSESFVGGRATKSPRMDDE